MNKQEELDSLTVHPLSDNIRTAWREFQKTKKIIKLDKKEIFDIKHIRRYNKLRVVCISDTHSQHHKMNVPDGDVLIHAGDFTKQGGITEVQEFNNFLGKLPHKHKIVIPGNHELSFDLPNGEFSERSLNKELKRLNVSHARELITNGTCLIDEEIVINGVKIYGSPWQPEFCSWAYNLDRGEPLLEKWKKIPIDTDILITHGPPFGHGDTVQYKFHVGCIDLLSVIECIRPRFHIFGHIHEDYGITTDEETVFINASSCNLRYKPVNPPIIFEIEKKKKEELEVDD